MQQHAAKDYGTGTPVPRSERFKIEEAVTRRELIALLVID